MFLFLLLILPSACIHALQTSCLQKTSAPLIPNEHTPDEDKPGIADKRPSPKEEPPTATKTPPLASPETDAEASIAKDKTH